VTAIKDTANVLGSPPVVLLALLAGGGLVHLLLPVDLFPDSFPNVIGLPLIALAIALFMLSVREFSRQGTPVRGSEPASVVVASGPYRFSRNPIYLSMLLLEAGIAIMANSAWIMVAILFMFAYLSLGVIAREEIYLVDKFGDEYLRYKASVRRWI
jgi:protein-S-isoprenylcysteine O-methyltransferase Ste14